MFLYLLTMLKAHNYTQMYNFKMLKYLYRYLYKSMDNIQYLTEVLLHWHSSYITLDYIPCIW